MPLSIDTFKLPWVPPSLGKAPYLWLASLAFVFWKYLYVPPSALEALALAVTVAVFVPLYFASFWQRGNAARLCVLLTCLIGALWAPVNPGAGNFFVFAAAMCANVGPPRAAYAMLAVALASGTLATMLASQYAIVQLLLFLALGSTIGVACIMDASLRRSREALLRKQEEVERMATIAERERIARDLHDLLGHTLSLIAIKAELAGKQFARDPAACRSEIGDIERIARHALAEVRGAVSGYREGGLAQALGAARASLLAARVELTEQLDQASLPPPVEHAMALALREAVTNVVRHARAAHCALGLKVERGMAVLRVADNGSALTAAPRHGNGLNGMRERAEALGGTLALRWADGLVLELSIPMEAP